MERLPYPCELLSDYVSNPSLENLIWFMAKVRVLTMSNLKAIDKPFMIIEYEWWLKINS